MNFSIIPEKLSTKTIEEARPTSGAHIHNCSSEQQIYSEHI